MYFPTEALKVFLSKSFAYPLLRWRMFRNGFFSFPAHLQERVFQEVISPLRAASRHFEYLSD